MANRHIMTSLAVAPDTLVTLSYTLFDEQGEEVDRATENEPLKYVHGYAQIVPGLEKGLEGLCAGERREIVVDAADAFGEHDDEGVFEVDKEDFPESSEVSLGDEFVAQGPDGHPIAMRVIELLEGAFLVDTNHPLAGQKVRFDVEVADVRPAEEEEIARAQADLEQRIGHAHDGCCDHDHDHDHDPTTITRVSPNRSSRFRRSPDRLSERHGESIPMSSRTDKAKTTAWDYDLRVRDRNLANGTLEPKAVDKYLVDLPDLEAQCETLELAQPALGNPED